MNGYFRPLRRKFGIVLLTLACVFAAAWVRSLSINDNLFFPMGRHQGYCLISLNGEIALWITNTVTPSVPTSKLVRWRGGPIDGESWETDHLKWTFKIYGFGSGVASTDSLGSFANYWLAPYWSIVIPLTLLSAWLLLSKSQSEKPDK